MLSRRIISLSVILSIACNAMAQVSINLGAPVNSQLTSEYSPSLTGNGRTMIFTSTTGEDNKPEIVISNAKAGIWSRPETVPNFTTVTGKIPIPKDAVISYGGNIIYFGASKFGGVGGTDIWYMEKTGNIWSVPKNMAKPINSVGHEGDPSISPDERFLYFVRYSDKKSPTGLPCGKIFVSEKTGNLWKEPKELPSPINMGCECNPRILADNQTLIFASVRSGGKGGFDQYRTQMKDDGTWTTPVPMTFINTEKDDQYVSVPAQGDFIFHTKEAKASTDIVKTQIPEELRAKKVISIEGYVKDKQTQLPLSARVVVYDTKKNKIANIIQTDATGRYLMYLTAGTKYDFSVAANNKGYSFYSEFIDLDTLSKFREINTQVNLSMIKKDVSVKLANLSFENGSDKIMSRSSFELDRIVRMLQDNPTTTLEIEVNTDHVIMDSIPSPQLTEVIVDSVEIADPADTTGIHKIKIAKKTYHNNITQKQADAIVAALNKKGIGRERLVAKGYGDKNPLVPNTSEQNKAINRRTEIKVLKP